MGDKSHEFLQKFSIQLVGEHKKIDDLNKAILNEKLLRFVDSYRDTFSEGDLVVDVKHKKGNHNHGRYRKIPLVFTKVRFSTDRGLFLAKKENWGANASIHDALNVIQQQINTKLHYQPKKEKEPVIYMSIEKAENIT